MSSSIDQNPTFFCQQLDKSNFDVSTLWGIYENYSWNHMIKVLEVIDKSNAVSIFLF